jgi:hypothetical protein
MITGRAHRRLLLASLAFALPIGALRADDAPGNALPLLDAWLARAAADNPSYRKDIRRGGSTAGTPPGRCPGVSPVIGPFTYVPKTYSDLVPSERAALIRDPNLRLFLAASRGERDRGITGGTASARPSPEKFSVAAAEMLHSRPMFIALPGIAETR